MPITDSIAAQATQAYSDALSRASDHYLPARSLVSAQISGEPKPVHQEMFSSVESAYSDSVASASSQLQAAMSAASAAIYGTPLSSQQSLYAAPSSAYWGPPKEALESISSTAASKLSEGLSAASAHYTDAQSYAGAVQTGPAAKQKLLAQMQDQYYAGVGMAHARYSEFLNAASSAVMQTQTPFHEDVASVASEKVQAGASQASSAVYGSETPWTESVASAASENWEALITKASSQIYGAPTPYFVTRRLLSEAREYASSATAGAASQYSAVQSLISELVSGKEPDFTESVYSRFSKLMPYSRLVILKLTYIQALPTTLESAKQHHPRPLTQVRHTLPQALLSVRSSHHHQPSKRYLIPPHPASTTPSKRPASNSTVQQKEPTNKSLHLQSQHTVPPRASHPKPSTVPAPATPKRPKAPSPKL
jgi:hypothetical protein